MIPARNAARTIAETISAALEQTFSEAIELIVAVSPEDHSTREALVPFAGRIRIVDNPMGTTSAGLNIAIAAATGSIIVRCDAHSTLPPDYVAHAVEALEATGAANVGGVQHAVGDGFVQRSIAIAQTTPLGVGDARYRLGGSAGPVDTVYLGVFRREVIDRLGGFDERFQRNQDYELNHRIRESGEIVWFDPSLVVDYRVRPSLRALARQYFDYGAGKRLMLRHHPHSIKPRQVVAPLLVVGLAISAVTVLAGFRPWGWLPGLIYLTALLAAAIAATARRRDAAALLLPVVLAIMHIAWGIGFLSTRPGRAQHRT